MKDKNIQKNKDIESLLRKKKKKKKNVEANYKSNKSEMTRSSVRSDRFVVSESQV